MWQTLNDETVYDVKIGKFKHSGTIIVKTNYLELRTIFKNRTLVYKDISRWKIKGNTIVFFLKTKNKHIVFENHADTLDFINEMYKAIAVKLIQMGKCNTIKEGLEMFDNLK